MKLTGISWKRKRGRKRKRKGKELGHQINLLSSFSIMKIVRLLIDARDGGDEQAFTLSWRPLFLY